MISKIILGDNPFFGINHRSGEKASKYLSQKSDFSVASSVIEEASKLGIDSLMVTTHAELPELLSVLEKSCDEKKLKKPSLSLGVPYAHKLNSVVAEHGLLGLFTLIRPHRLFLSGFKDLFALLLKGRKFPKHIFSEFISSEFRLADGYIIEHVCFQNLLTDMILGLDRTNVFHDICAALENTGAKPVFITMNPIEMDKRLPAGVPICFHYNINGFMVQPSLKDVQNFIESTNRPLWAMGVLASGAIDLQDALADPYLDKFEKVLYATSKPERVRSFVETIGKSS